MRVGSGAAGQTKLNRASEWSERGCTLAGTSVTGSLDLGDQALRVSSGRCDAQKGLGRAEKGSSLRPKPGKQRASRSEVPPKRH